MNSPTFYFLASPKPLRVMGTGWIGQLATKDRSEAAPVARQTVPIYR